MNQDVVSPLKTKRVTNLTLNFINGEKYVLTLQSTDSYFLVDGSITIDMLGVDKLSRETTIVPLRNLLLYAVWPHDVPDYAPGESPIEKSIAEVIARNRKPTVSPATP